MHVNESGLSPTYAAKRESAERPNENLASLLGIMLFHMCAATDNFIDTKHSQYLRSFDSQQK